MRKEQLSPKLRQEAERLAALPDATIDIDDIPELPAAAWKAARHRPMSTAANDAGTLPKAG